MFFGSALAMFVLVGIGVCIDKLIAGDRSMGCLIPILIFVILIIFVVPVVGFLINLM